MELTVLMLLAVAAVAVTAVVGGVFLLLKLVFWVVFLPIRLLFIPVRLLFLPIRLLMKLVWLPVGLAFGAVGISLGAVVPIVIVALAIAGFVTFAAVVIGLMIPAIPVVLFALLIWTFARRSSAVSTT